MSYLDAPATKLAKTFCCCCGKKLGDSLSIELGIGPDCRHGNNEGLTAEQQRACNKLTHAAAIAAQRGQVEIVRQLANEIRQIGLTTLADKVANRFVNAEKKTKIKIEARGDMLYVVTPYKRSADDFVAAWRDIPGRRYDRSRNANVIPVSSKTALWELLKKYFPGEFGTGPQGMFRVPKPPKDDDDDK
jgi:hypothetical protein